MKHISLLILVIFGMLGMAHSQNVEIIYRSSDNLNKIKNKTAFHFIEKGLDSTRLTYVARMKVKASGNPSLASLYSKMKSEGKKLGANAFRLLQFDPADQSLTVDLCLAKEDVINVNNLLKPLNTVTIFAGDIYEKTAYFSFEFNGGVRTLKNGTYFKYKLREGEQAKLKKGTVTGTTMWIKWKPNQLPNYYTIHGFSKEAIVKRTTVSQSSKPGKFMPVEAGLGAMLSVILTENLN
jgi:hypothetical protein